VQTERRIVSNNQCKGSDVAMKTTMIAGCRWIVNLKLRNAYVIRI